MKCPKCQAEMEETTRKWKTSKTKPDAPALSLPEIEDVSITVCKCPKCGYAEISK